MNQYKSAAFNYLKDEKKIHVKEIDEVAFSVCFEGDNCKDIPVIVIFDEDGSNHVAVRCFGISNAQFAGKEAAALALCNALNNQFRWVKFTLNDDAEISASIDGILDLDTCGEEIYHLIMLIVGITDEAYPEIMRARFS
ncbi:MAG: YbjN domain-containing protein [Clostridia bacterium]|nr:YbjN domain-containing protein [Clostridia bacterium]